MVVTTGSTSIGPIGPIGLTLTPHCNPKFLTAHAEPTDLAFLGVRMVKSGDYPVSPRVKLLEFQREPIDRIPSQILLGTKSRLAVNRAICTLVRLWKGGKLAWMEVFLLIAGVAQW